MKNDVTNTVPELVVIGGGFAGLQLIKELKNKSVNITLIDKFNFHTFLPLLYQVATGGLSPNSIAFPFRKIFKGYKNFRFRMAEVKQIDTINNIVETTAMDIPYDLLVIATGSVPNYFGNNNIASNSISLKNMNDALLLSSSILKEFEKALTRTDIKERQGLLNFVIVGGGPTGVEIAGALGEFKKYILPNEYPDLPVELMNIHLFQADNRILPVMSEKASVKSLEYLEKLGVTVWLNTFVKDYDGVNIHLSDGKTIKAETLIWTAGVKANMIPGIKPESVDLGRYIVDEYNKVSEYENIFAIGDVAKMASDKYPKGHPMVAPVAVQQAKNLAKNILILHSKKILTKFQYIDKGSMATIGKNKAVVDLPLYKFQGTFAWFVWMFIHLIQLTGLKNKFFVLIDWFWNYLTYERASQLIINPLIKDNCKVCEGK